ncbi:restriction endonuclease subunit S [Capnocytophaga leadbetteri]|uniref:restriction endonuclease subunit S n=1 Tax=Capnocytophaga leadbetteri TaxID=327575 RepID=UPI001E2E9971
MGDWGAGATPLRGNIEYYGGKIPWLKTGELNNGLIISTEEYITDKALEECSLRFCNVGDILIAMYGATIGKLGIAAIKLTTNQACCACTPIFIYNKFLFYFLMASKQSFIEQGEGGAQPNISRIKLVNYLFPLPPLKEQQRIVEKIEELIPHIEHYGKAQAELNTLNKNIKEQLKKSVLQYAIEGKLVPQDEAEGTAEELLLQIQKEKLKLYEENKLKKKDLEHSTIFKGEDNKYYEKIGKNVTHIDEEIPFEIPNGWVWARMGQIADLYTGNSINEQEKKAQYMNTEGVPYIGTKDIGFDGKVLYQNGVAIPKKHLSLFKKAYSNSILMCIEGGSAGRKITLIDKTVCFGNKLCCITSYYEKIRYLFYYLQSPMFFEIFNQNKNGIIGGVSVNNLKNLIVPLPPLAEQLRIVESIDAIFRCIKN